MSTVYLLVGLPGSGKSTWAVKRVKNNRIVIINQDTIRTMLKGEYFYDKEYEPLVHQMAYNCFKEALKEELDVILDQTNLGKQRRLFWIANASLENAKVVCVHFTEVDNCLERRMRSPKNFSREEWAKVIDDMKKWYEEPSVEEGFDSIIKVDGNGLENYK